jgi:peptidoglycan/LPS O-acetylase OafA/YrhL
LTRFKRAAPYLLLFAVSFPLWYLGMRLLGGQSLLDHSPIDQHTRQARAWLDGRLDLAGAPKYLEIARYDGRFYDSFPPTPALVEVPLVLVFGKKTPNGPVMYALWLLALAAMFSMLQRRGFSEGSALLAALAFVFGTNLYATCPRAKVWAWGQGLGFCLAILGLWFVIDNKRSGLRGPTSGYVLLSLAVGCRPFYLFMAPLFVVLDRQTSRPDLRRVLWSAALAMAPVGIALAALNYARFGNPLEFGHDYLGWAQALPEGIFSLSHLGHNLYHAALQLPTLVNDDPPVEFDPWGTAFWLNNGIFLFCLAALVRGGFDRWVRAAAALGLGCIWFGLLLHQTNGWRQFGYRFLIDLLPIGFVLFLYGYRRFNAWMSASLLWSFAVNLYGLWAWKELPRPFFE